MKEQIIGRKIGMTQVFGDKGVVIPVTVVEAGPCTIVQIKTMEKDGYNAVVVAFEEIKKQRATGARTGIFKKANTSPKRILREFRFDEACTCGCPDGTCTCGENCTCKKVGDIISADVFKAGDVVDVTARTKGRGFTGTIKRWNFNRQRETHGNSRSVRVPGSLGSNSDPSRVFKNKKMPGQYGNEQVTIQNLTIVRVDSAKNAILVKGGIPGPNGILVSIKTAVKGGKK